MENATKATLSNVGREAVHVLNNTTSQFASHSSTIESAGPILAAFGFMPGLFGLKRG
jgi:hypothetical protein